MSHPSTGPPDKSRKKPAKKRREKEEEPPSTFFILGTRDVSWALLGERIIILPDGRVIRIPAVPYFGMTVGS